MYRDYVQSWHQNLLKRTPPVLYCLDKISHVPRTDEQIVTIANGGYILQDCAGIPQAIILATGSEVELALTAQTALEAKGIKVRVVSMSSCDTFNAQDATYRKQVLPATCLDRVVAVVAAMESLL